MIDCKDVTYTHGEKVLLDRVNISFPPGSCTAIVGSSGSGKTLLCNLLLKILNPTSGTIEVDKVNLAMLPPRFLQMYRKSIGTVFQDNLLSPIQSVQENIGFPLEEYTISDEQIALHAKDALRTIKLVRLAHSLPQDISRGQRRLVSIARALVTQPKILLLDEPCIDLDEPHIQTISALLRKMHREGKTIIICTRNESFAQKIHADIYELCHGRLESLNLPQKAKSVIVPPKKRAQKGIKIVATTR